MTHLLSTRSLMLVVSCAVATAAGCTLDFNEAIPCDTDNQCPAELQCNVVIRRCERAESPTVDRDTGDEDIDEVDTEEEDGRRLPDTSTQDVADADDAVDDTVDAQPGDGSTFDADSDSDAATSDAADVGDDSDAACVPSAEVCDGLDNDCDGVADNGITCGGEGCSDDMVEVTPSAGEPFCIDIYEASRIDATATAEGVDTARATSRVGVLPWRFVTYDDAEAACAAAGKRLCTAEEWQAACGGADGWDYPYNARLYNGQSCNGLNTPPLSGPAATGQFTDCVSPVGVFDMSGNVSEWTTNRFPIGGAYDDVSQNLRCNAEDRVVNPSVSEPQAGFRCCRTP